MPMRVWNEVGKFVGIIVDPGRAEAGNIGEIKVQHDNQGVATEATSTYAVTGDFSEPCGGAWFPSNLYISDKKDHQPDCFWIDKIGDQPKTGFQVRWPAYSEDRFDENNKDPKRLCNNVDFGLREGKRPQFNQLLSQEKTRRKSPGLSFYHPSPWVG
ncbi:hypothetical protein HL42_0254 [Trichophyton rubrum]|nr:hypothetical protein HL42_0254 [Trichophyton rubrum]